jgi:hypothetical protein
MSYMASAILPIAGDQIGYAIALFTQLIHFFSERTPLIIDLQKALQIKLYAFSCDGKLKSIWILSYLFYVYHHYLFNLLVARHKKEASPGRASKIQITNTMS